MQKELEEISGSTADATASAGFYSKVLASQTLLWQIGKLKKGSYMILFRAKRSVTGSASFNISLGGGLGNYEYFQRKFDAANNTTVTTNWTDFYFTFSVADDTDNQNFFIMTEASAANELHMDYAMIIPLSDGFGFTYDIIMQILTSNNTRNIGVF